MSKHIVLNGTSNYLTFTTPSDTRPFREVSSRMVSARIGHTSDQVLFDWTGVGTLYIKAVSGGVTNLQFVPATGTGTATVNISAFTAGFIYRFRYDDIGPNMAYILEAWDKRGDPKTVVSSIVAASVSSINPNNRTVRIGAKLDGTLFLQANIDFWRWHDQWTPNFPVSGKFGGQSPFPFGLIADTPCNEINGNENWIDFTFEDTLANSGRLGVTLTSNESVTYGTNTVTPPTAVGESLTGVAKGRIPLNAARSYDYDSSRNTATNLSDVLATSWTYDSGPVSAGAITIRNPDKLFTWVDGATVAGVYTFHFAVTNGVNTDSDTVTIEVVNLVAFINNVNGYVDEPTLLDATASTGWDSIKINTGENIPGTTMPYEMNLPRGVHRYHTPGSYNVVVTAYDAQGNSITATATATIVARPTANAANTEDLTNSANPNFIPPSDYITNPTGNATKLQNAIDIAKARNTVPQKIVVPPGARMDTDIGIVLKNPVGNEMIDIVSSGTLPQSHIRVSANDAPQMFTVRATAANTGAINTETSAHHYRLRGLILEASAQQNEIVRFGNPSTERTDSAIAHHFVLQHCIVRATNEATVDISNSIMFNADDVSIIDNRLEAVSFGGLESHNTLCYSAHGRHVLSNNYYGGASSNLFYGGAASVIRGLVPSDIEIRENLLTRPLWWQHSNPAWDGRNRNVKNNWELKTGSYICSRGNKLENTWTQGQQGISAFIQATCDAGNWATANFVDFSYSWFYNVEQGIEFRSSEFTATPQSRKAWFTHNLLEGLTTRAYLLLSAWDVRMNHNTALAVNSGSTAVMDYNMRGPGFMYENSIAYEGLYGWFGSGYSPGIGGTQIYLPGLIFRNSLQVGGSSGQYSSPATAMQFPANEASVGFTNPSSGIWSLADSSPYKGTATDGTDPGVNWTDLQISVAHVTDGNWLSGPPPSVGAIAFDSFTDTNGTNLQSHIMSSGHTWTKHSVALDNAIIDTNRLTKDAGTGVAMYYHNISTPDNAYVQATFGVMSQLTSNTGIAVRFDTATLSGYVLRHIRNTTVNEFRMEKYTNGTATTLGSAYHDAVANGATRLMRLEARGTSLKGYIDGVERISVSDATYTSGKFGVRLGGAASTTTGDYLDDFEAGVLLPIAPSGLTVTAISTTQVDLSWTDNASDEASFRVERKTGVSGSYVEIGSTSANVTTYSDTTTSANATYFYRVRARNAMGDSAYCQEQSVTTATGFATFLSDTFTDTSGTTLSSHTGEGGVTYTKHPNFSDTMSIQSNRVGKDGTTGVTAYYASVIPPTVQYTVEADIVDIGSIDIAAGIAGWMDIASDSMIVVRRQNSGNWQFLKIVNGVATTLATSAAVFSAGASRRLRLSRLANNFFEWSIDNVPIGAPVQINDVIFSGAGRVGFRASGNHSGTGYHIDNLVGSFGVPTAPSALNLNVISSTRIDLSWTDNSLNEDSFRIERKTGSGGTYVEITTVGANVTSYSDTTLSPSTTYFYRVRSHNDQGDSTYLTEQSATTSSGGASPAAPSSLIPIPIGFHEVMLMWTDNSIDEDSFRIERKIGVNGTYSEIGFTDSNIISFYDGTVSPSTTYFYRVKARNSFGDSAYLSEQSVTTPAVGSTATICAANLQHGQDTSTAFNFATQVNSLIGADIVCVQERSTTETGWNTPLSSAGMTQAVFKAHIGTGDGNAIWIRPSTVTVLQTYSFDLANGVNPTSGSSIFGWDGSTDIRRSVCAAKVSVGGVQFYVVSVHFAHSAAKDSSSATTSVQRETQIQSLISWVNTTLTGELPTVLSGDFNFNPQTPRISGGFMRDYFTEAGYLDTWTEGIAANAASAPWGDRDGNGTPDMPLGSTTTVTHDTKRIDYIWLKPGNGALVQRHTTMPDLRAICPHGLVSGACTPEVQQLWANMLDMGVRPSDHNFLKTSFNAIAVGANTPPTVNAGSDQVLPGTATSTTLNGSTFDVNGDAITKLWTLVSGPNVPSIQSPTNLSTSVTGLIVGSYVFRLSANDGINPPVSDDVGVLVNSSPTVNAGTNQNLSVGTTSTSLAGIATDPNADNLTTTWTQMSGPNTANIASPSSLNTNVTGLITGSYVFRLTVSDGVNPAVTSQVQVIIAENIIPIVTTGSDQTLTAETTSTNVTATASDPDGGAVSVVWTRVSGPNNPTIVSPNSLTTVINGLIPGVYIFRCTATDNEGTTGFDEVMVRINRLPVVNAGVDQTLASGTTSTTLIGTATDIDGDTLTYQWTRISGPNTPAIVSATSLSTSVTGLITGTYVFRLSVNDGVNTAVTDDVQVIILTAEDLSPVVNIMSSKRLPFKVTQTTLTATAVDPEGQTLTKTWSKVSGPGTPTIVSPNSLTTQVTGLQKGIYVFRISVSDGVNTPITKDVTITVPFSRGSLGGSVSVSESGGSVTGR